MEAKDAYQVAHQLALNEDVENAAGQWERVASLATKMLGAAYEISSSEGPAAIEFAEKAKAAAECEVKEAVLADAARAYVDAIRRAQTADDWRSVVAFAARRLRASTDLPLSVETREGKIQDAKEAKTEAERKEKEAKAEAERLAKKDKNAKAAMRLFSRDPFPFSVRSSRTSSSASNAARRNHKAAEVEEKEVHEIKIMDFDAMPVEFGTTFFNSVKNPNTGDVDCHFSNEREVQTAVLRLGMDIVDALEKGSVSFREVVMRLEEEMGTLAYRTDIFVVVGPNRKPVGLIEVKCPQEREPGKRSVLEDDVVSGQVYDYMKMLLLYHNCSHIFAISTTLVEWRFYWLGNEEWEMLQSDAINIFEENMAEDARSTSRDLTSSDEAASSTPVQASDEAAPSTPVQATQKQESSPPRTPAKSESEWVGLSIDGDVDDDVDDEEEESAQEVEDEGIRTMQGTRVLNSRNAEDAARIIDLLATFFVHMSQCETLPRADPLEQFPLRQFGLCRRGNGAMPGFCNANLLQNNFADVEVPSGKSFARALSELRHAGKMNQFGESLLKAVRRNTFKYPARITTTKQLLLVEDLGYGATSHAFLACNMTATAFCVVKGARYMSKEITQEDAAKSLKAEAVNWEKIYGVSDDGGDVLIQNLRVVSDFWGGRPCLIMPYCQPIPKEDRESYLGLVQTTLVEHFAKRGYIHHDVRWRNIGLVQVNDSVKAVVYDLAPHGDLTNGVCKAPSADLTDSLAQMSMSSQSSDDLTDSLAQMSMSSQSSDDGLPKWIADAMKKLKSTM